MNKSCVLVKNKYSANKEVLKNLTNEILGKAAVAFFKAERIHVTQEDVLNLNKNFNDLGLEFEVESVMNVGDDIYLMTIAGAREGKIEHILYQNSPRLKKIESILPEEETLDDVFYLFTEEESEVVSDYYKNNIQKVSGEHCL